MPTFTPTKLTGATAKPNLWLQLEPDQVVTDEQLAAPFEGTGLNGAFVSDLLSAMVTHERCGVHLYRAAATRSNNPILEGKYEEFGDETRRHVEILEELITAAGGNPSYVSPMARAVEAMDAKLVESTYLGTGTIDVMTAESALLDAVFLAETICHSNWRTFKSLAGELPAGDFKVTCEEAIAEVEEQEDEHLEWAQKTKERIVSLQARSDLVANVGEKAEELVARVRNWLS